MMDDASVDAVFPAMQDVMGEELIAAYEFPGYGDDYFSPVQRDITLLIVVRRETSIHEIRTHYLAHFAGAPVGAGPALWVTTEPAIRRYLRLNPLFARHLANRGQRLTGESLCEGNVTRLHPAERLAFLAHRSLIASAALAPGRLPAPQHEQAVDELRLLATFLSNGNGQLSPQTTPMGLFALVQQHLQQQMAALSLRESRRAPVEDARESNLEAMYEDRDFLLVVIPPLSGNLLRKLDWQTVLQQAPEHLTALVVGTAPQLRLAVQSERPLDHLLANFRHLWGRNPLSGLRVSRQAVFRQAARKAAELLYGLSADYVAAGDDEAVHRVIHDYQNRLLNIQLEHELLHRTQDVERAGPEEALPRRNEPNETRIGAIAQHLEWWTAYYAGKMAEATAAETMAPQ